MRGPASGLSTQAEPIAGQGGEALPSGQPQAGFSDALLNVVSTLMAAQGKIAPGIGGRAVDPQDEETAEKPQADASPLKEDAQQQLLQALLMTGQMPASPVNDAATETPGSETLRLQMRASPLAEAAAVQRRGGANSAPAADGGHRRPGDGDDRDAADGERCAISRCAAPDDGTERRRPHAERPGRAGDGRADLRSGGPRFRPCVDAQAGQREQPLDAAAAKRAGGAPAAAGEEPDPARHHSSRSARDGQDRYRPAAR
jgi:hypothetical protein